MTINQTERVPDEELDQMIWKLERDGMTPKMLSLMRELREVRRAKGDPVARELQEHRKAVATPIYQLFDMGWYDTNKQTHDNAVSAGCAGRIVYTAKPELMKDHQIRELVNDLRDIAIEYHGTQQLRDRISRTVRAAMLQSSGNSEQPEPVSNCDELPLDYLQGHKDGLGWAAQLAEANHPQTGDWLYDDPIALAAAIRKGPDMPELKSASADKGDNFYSWFGRFWSENYQQNNYTTSAKQMLGTMAEFAFRAGRESATQAGNSPATPDGWIPVSERMPENATGVLVASPWQCAPGGYAMKWAVLCPGHPDADSDGWVIPGASWSPTHWQPLPAAPKEVG
ncbi:DUF551 domain-containing protein [Kluyvera intermedia]|uniref:DUF551 domain-containing protein n=1 Tax=Kluyvera intermedia TaxID=61648 RepID=UPI003B9DFE69